MLRSLDYRIIDPDEGYLKPYLLEGEACTLPVKWKERSVASRAAKGLTPAVRAVLRAAKPGAIGSCWADSPAVFPGPIGSGLVFVYCI